MRTGGPGFDRAIGSSFWDAANATDEMSASYNDYIAASFHYWVGDLIDYLERVPGRAFAELGGGPGQVLGQILAADTRRTGIVIELEEAGEGR